MDEKIIETVNFGRHTSITLATQSSTKNENNNTYTSSQTSSLSRQFGGKVIIAERRQEKEEEAISSTDISSSFSSKMTTNTQATVVTTSTFSLLLPPSLNTEYAATSAATKASSSYECQSSPRRKKSPSSLSSPYEELKIKDGPIYKRYIMSTDHNSPLIHNNRGDSFRSEMMESTSSSSQNQVECVTEQEEFSYELQALPAETTALLVVDVQPEYWSNCPAVRKDFPDFPSRLSKTIDLCRRRKTKIIWVRADYQYSQSPWLTQFQKLRGNRNLGEVPCDPTSPEFTWEDFATPEGGEVIIAKSSWSSTNNTALIDVLKVAHIENVLVCGLITSVCVQHSAFGIFEAGYRTMLVTDACADRGRARHDAALALYGDYMYELITSDDLECKTTGLLPAEPLWMVFCQKSNIVRANSFPKQFSSSNYSGLNSINHSTDSNLSCNKRSSRNGDTPPSMVHSSSCISIVTDSICTEEEGGKYDTVMGNGNSDKSNYDDDRSKDSVKKASETVNSLVRCFMVPELTPMM